MALTRITKGVIKPNENYDTHNIKSTGIITAVSFVGDGAGLTGIASTDYIITGTAATFTGGVDINSDLDVDGHTNLDNVSIAGVTTFAGAISGTTASFSGNVSIGGTLTYEDVTNIDSVGLITARNGINIQDDATFTGATTNMVWDKSDSKLKFNNILNIYNKDGSSRIEGASGGMFFKATGAYVWSNNSLSTRFEALDSSCILYASGSKIARSRPGELQIGNPDGGVGVAVTIGISGNALFGGTGIVTATKFVGDGSSLTGISVGPGTGEQYVIIDQNGNNSNSGTNVYAGYRSGQSLASGGTNENTFYGTDSGKATSTGGYNTYIGHRAGENSTQSSNTAVGAEALRNNTFGSGNNTAVGQGAAQFLGSATNSIAIGYQALKGAGAGAGSTVTGTSNIAIGVNAGDALKDGAQNILIGENCGGAMVSSHWNVAIGKDCADAATGLGNVIIGHDAGRATSGNYNVVLGKAAGDVGSFSGANNIIIGYNADPTSASTSNEITLGDSNISKFRIPGLDFTVDGSGNLAVNGDITTGSTTDAELKINAASSMSSYVERNDGVWGSWGPVVQLKSTANSPGGTTFGRWGNHSEGHQVVFTKSRSNGSGGTSVAAGDDLGSIFWSPYNSANPGCSVQISVKADTGTWSSTSNPGYLAIKTTPSGQKNPSERMRFTSSGRIDILGDGGNAGFTLSNAYGQAGFFGGMYYNGSSWTRNAIGTRKGAGMYVNTGGHIAFLKAPETSGTSATVTESLRIDSDGKVGINEASPSRTVSIDGSVNIQSGQRIESYSSSGNLIVQGGSTYPGGHIRMWGGSGDDCITFNTSGSGTSSVERMRVAANGNIGIGNRTSNPNSLLHVHTASGDAVAKVEGGADAWLSLISHGGDSQIRFGDASSGSSGQIRFDHGTDHLFFEKGGSQRGKIASDGSTYWGPSGYTEAHMQWTHDTNQRPHIFWGQGGGAQPSDGAVVIASPQTDICSQRVGTLIFGSATSGGTGNTGLKAVLDCYTNASPGSDYNAGGYLRFLTKPNNATLAERMRIESNGDIAINTTDGDFGQSNSASNFAKGDPKLGVHGSIAIMNTSSTTTDYSQLAFYRRTTAEPQGNGSHRITSTSNLGRISWNGASNDTSFPDEVCVIQAVANGGDWWSGSNRRASLQFHNNNVGEMARFDSNGVFSGRPIMNRNTSGVSGGGWTTSGAWKVLVDLNIYPGNALYMCDAAMQNLGAYTATFWVYKSDNAHYCIVYEETSLCSFRLNGTQIEIRQNSGADQTNTSGYQKVFCALGMSTPKS